MLDAGGRVTCATAANLFMVEDGELLTPSLAVAGVAGVMRRAVLEEAGRQGIGVRESRLELERVMQAEELMLTNSLIGVWPVSRLEDRSLRVGATTRALWAAIEGRGIACAG